MISSFDPLHILARWIAIPLALVPAALNWWWRRTLLGVDATIRPERHFAVAQRVSSVTILCSLMIIVLAGWQALWIVPSQLLALTCSAYRTRRALFGETWSLRRYLAWRMQWIVGVSGLWWALALAPALAASVSSSRWWLAAVLLLVALAWYHWHGRVLLSVLGASHLTRPDLDGPFNEVMRRARVAPPTLWRAGARGGVFANALALPSIRGSGVLFFDTLLERLSPREVTAIFAHEIAHLEYFSGRRLVAIYAITVGLMATLILGGAAMTPLVPGFESWVPAISFCTVFIGLFLRARAMQPKETEADLRAVELCGDADALVNGLIRVYEINHIPRRWSAQMEERATHPSLARRIHAIRQHSASLEPLPPIERLVIASPASGRLAFVDHERVGFLWYDGHASETGRDTRRARRAETFPYAELKELRIAATSGGALTLTAVSHHERRLSMPVAEHDAARVQAALDRVDHLIVPRPAAPGNAPLRAMVMAVIIAASISGASLPVLAPALLALRRPNRRLMIALAAALTVAAMLKWEEPVVRWTQMLVLAMFGSAALWTAGRTRQFDEESRVWFWLERMALILPTAIGLLLLAATARNLFELHATVRDDPWLITAGTALAVFLSLSTRRASRRLGPLVGAFAMLAMWIGSPVFLRAIVRDPLAADMPTISDVGMSLTPALRQSVEGQFTSLSTAPGGRTFLLATDADENAIDEEADAPSLPRRYMAGAFTGWSRPFEASEASPIDDERVLVLDRGHGTSRLHADDARTGQVLWTRSLAVNASLLQTDASGRWRVLARHGNGFTRIEGHVGSDDVAETHWTIAADRRASVAPPRIAEGAVALGLATMLDTPPPSPLLGIGSRQTTLLRASAEGSADIVTSRLTLDCLSPPMGIDSFVCLSFDGRWSRIWRLDSAISGLRPVGQTRGRFGHVRQYTRSLLSARVDGNLSLIDLDSATIRMLAPMREDCWFSDVSIAGNLIVTACAQRGTTRVIQYSVPVDHGRPES
ncbi:MAG TPA: M48 family metalloprotease [Vicinamibacterales bacterium]|nr:M48 family metalloprotease [Vicinamibacterales bacterium]